MIYKKLLAICLAIVCLSNYSAFAQQTVVWLVRHAEKQTTTSTPDPELSDAGTKRATDLADLLKSTRIGFIYSTNYKRTLATAMPLAKALKLNPVTYDARQSDTLIAKILQENKGKEVLVVGHSNTLIPLARALKANVPFTTLDDEDYDMLFKVVIDNNQPAKLYISYYGQTHHVTAIPASYTP